MLKKLTEVGLSSLRQALKCGTQVEQSVSPGTVTLQEEDDHYVAGASRAEEVVPRGDDIVLIWWGSIVTR